MSDPLLKELKKRLRDKNPKIRRQASKELGKLRHPAAIPTLAKVYRDEKEDPKVRAEAAKSLKIYGKMMPWSGGKLSPDLLKTAIKGLSGSFVVLVILNIVIRLVIGGGGDTLPTPTPGPTDRAMLLQTYQTLLQQTKADASAMRQEWSLGSGQVPCQAKLVNTQQSELRAIDSSTYPDFPGFVTELNGAIFTLQAVINDWKLACVDGSKGTVEQTNTSNDRLNQVDASLLTVDTLINQAITNPAPTQLSP